MDDVKTATVPTDACARRLVLVLVGVGAILFLFYGVLAIQAYRWHPAVYAQHTESPVSRTLLDATAPPWRPVATRRDVIAHGRDLYHRTGCAVCHGVEGKGGVTSPNYQRGTFPQLNNISERLFLEDAESHAAALEVLKQGVGLDEARDLDVDSPRVVAAQYANVVRIIQNGNPALKKDPQGVDAIPMPAWKDRLGPAETRDVVAYLVSLQDVRRFEEEEEEPEPVKKKKNQGGNRW